MTAKKRSSTKYHAKELTPQIMRQCRKRLGLTQARFGERLGTAMRTVQHWEDGTRRIPLMAEYLLSRIMADHEAVIKMSEKKSDET